MNFIDLFAGAGGLSEGFIKAGCKPIAHVEMDRAACFTLQTRLSYHYLVKNNKEDIYWSYILGQIDRKELYSHIPRKKLDSVINAVIGKDNKSIFERINLLKGDNSIDIIIGGPPCQSYSKLVTNKKSVEDKRNFLYKEYGKFLTIYKPKLFVFENVPNLKSAAEGKYYNNLKKYFKRIGYELEDRLLNTHDFEIVQNRERLIIIGWRKDIQFSYPDFEKIKHCWTRDDIFLDLPSLNAGQGKRTIKYKKPINNYLLKMELRNGVDFVSQHVTRHHNSNDLSIYKRAIKVLDKEGKGLKNTDIPESERTQSNTTAFVDRFKVIGIKPHTIIAHIAKDGHHYIHPDIKQLRSISVREAARIQAFPDDYYFEGIKENQNRSAAFKQIGNAVPPLLSLAIAKKLLKK